MKQKNNYNYNELIDCANGTLFGEGNAVWPDDVGASVTPRAGPGVCINEYDSSIHLVTVRKGLREVGVKGLTILVRSPRMWRVGHINRKGPLGAE